MVRSILSALLLLVCSAQVSAEAGDWVARVGASMVAPKSNNHSVVEVDSGTMLTFNVSYFVTNNWAVEVLAALPFEHGIDLETGGEVAEVDHLPPTVTAQYHFAPDAALRPYVGLGLNVTKFFDEKTKGALDGSDLKLDTSVGLAAQVGVDFDLSERMFFNLEVRYIDIDTDAKLDGADLGKVKIDPWLYGVNVGWRF